MDISTGHMILVRKGPRSRAGRGQDGRGGRTSNVGQSQAVVLLQAYMEDHLRNRDRLAKEWQALCAYQAEPNTCATAQGEGNVKKNRHPDFLPCK
jgi:hypothetical protein